MGQLSTYLKPFRGRIIACLVLVFIQAFAQLYLPTLMAEIVDVGVVHGKTGYIIRVGFIMLLVTFLGTLCMVVASFFSAKIAAGFSQKLRSSLFSHIETFSLHELDQVGTSSLITRTTNDINQLQQVLIMMLRMFVRAPLMSIGGIILAFSKDAQLALVLLAVIPVLGLLIYFVQKKGIPLFRAMQTKLDGLNQVLREGLTGIRVVRAFERASFEKERFDGASGELSRTAMKANRVMGVLFPVMTLVLNIATLGIMWFGSFRIDTGHLQVGDLMAFIQYAMQIMFALMMVSMMFVMIPRAQVSAGRIREVLNLSSSILETGAPVDEEVEGTIEFREVTFRYPGAERPALDGISFKAEKGKVTAIIGGTGSGKTTLMQLIPRFYELESGRIMIGGMDYHAFTQEELRALMGYVPQKATLFTGTIAENIRVGKPEATMEEVKQAADIAQASSFIEGLSDGYASMVSQGGTNLSGGQKQRLSIARAIVRRPSIYLFDDSFSALDYQTEAKLRQELKRETEQATVLIVAQRVNTIMDADHILVLEDGKLVGQGTHHQLLDSSHVYREIAASQLSEEEMR